MKKILSMTYEQYSRRARIAGLIISHVNLLVSFFFACRGLTRDIPLFLKAGGILGTVIFAWMAGLGVGGLLTVQLLKKAP